MQTIDEVREHCRFGGGGSVGRRISRTRYDYGRDGARPSRIADAQERVPPAWPSRLSI